MAATVARKMPDTYFALVKRFPLASIRDDGELKGAIGVIHELLPRRLDDGEQGYLDALTDLVEVYENARHPIPDAPEGDVLRLLMESHGVSQTALRKATGVSQSTISAALNGTRRLTRESIEQLSAYFHVSPAAFMPRTVAGHGVTASGWVRGVV